MVRLFLVLFFTLFGLLGVIRGATAVEEPSITISSSTSTENIELSVKTVRVLDSATIQVTFSDAVDRSSVVLKITKQADSSSIEIADLREVADAPESVDVILKDELEEGSSYTLTALAAIGISGSTIIDGAGALREFVTPSPLKNAVEVLNAPPNPNAIISTNTGDTRKEIPSTMEEGKKEETQEVPVPTEELPLTGANSFLFLLLALPLAYFFLRKKSV